jgi:hypothetical protein
MMSLIFVILKPAIGRGVFFCVALLAIVSASSMARADDVRLEWLPIPDAVGYDLEVTIAKQKQAQPLLKHSIETRISVELAPGSYEYRVRAIYPGEEQGPWSDLLAFVVSSRPIELVAPADQFVVDLNSHIPSTILRWKEGPVGSVYQVQIVGATGVVVDQTLTTSTMEWKPVQTGAYRWRVSYGNATSETWSEMRSLKVARNENLLPSPAIVPVAPVPAATPASPIAIPLAVTPNNSGTAVTPVTQNLRRQRPRRVYSIVKSVWFGASATQYQGNFVDVSNSVSSTTVSDNYGFQIALGGFDKSSWAFSFDAWLARQAMVQSTRFLPSVLAKVGYDWAVGAGRIGLFAAMGPKYVGLYVIDAFKQYTSDSTTRLTVQAGVRGNIRVRSDVSLSPFLSTGMDTSGKSDLAPSGFDNSNTLSAGLLATFTGRAQPVYARIQYTHDSLTWASQEASPNSFSITQYRMDLGYGF